MIVETGRILIVQEPIPYWLSNLKWSALDKCAYEQNLMDSIGCLCVCVWAC